MTLAQATLWWIPVGAGGHIVVHTSRWWELIRARRDRRAPRPLFHAALEVAVENTRYVIEMTPAWGNRERFRGVVATGPVGSRVLGISRMFRYEVRCWEKGTILDVGMAVGGPVVFQLADAHARALVARVPSIPRFTWGRDVFSIGDMWNSNSLVAWLLQTSGFEAVRLSPPGTGWAPGWLSGVMAAR